MLGAAVNLMLRRAHLSLFLNIQEDIFFSPFDSTIPYFLSTLEIEEFPNTRFFIVQQARQILHSLRRFIFTWHSQLGHTLFAT